MKMKKVIAIALIGCSSLYAQEDNGWKLFPGDKENDNSGSAVIKKDTVTNTPPKKDEARVGSLVVVQDKRINKLIEKEIRINEENKTIPGFRIQLFSGTGANVKTEANEIKSSFLKTHENVPAYVKYHDSIWKTRVGDFRTKLEAEKFLLEIQEEFPNSFVVSDDINFPEIKIK